jgi:hypothetical protein
MRIIFFSPFHHTTQGHRNIAHLVHLAFPADRVAMYHSLNAATMRLTAMNPPDVILFDFPQEAIPVGELRRMLPRSVPLIGLGMCTKRDRAPHTYQVEHQLDALIALEPLGFTPLYHDSTFTMPTPLLDWTRVFTAVKAMPNQSRQSSVCGKRLLAIVGGSEREKLTYKWRVRLMCTVASAQTGERWYVDFSDEGCSLIDTPVDDYLSAIGCYDFVIFPPGYSTTWEVMTVALLCGLPTETQILQNDVNNYRLNILTRKHAPPRFLTYHFSRALEDCEARLDLVHMMNRNFMSGMNDTARMEHASILEGRPGSALRIVLQWYRGLAGASVSGEPIITRAEAQERIDKIIGESNKMRYWI